MKRNINQKIDHTLLKQDSNTNAIKKLCDEAIKHCFYSVCIPPSYASFAFNILKNSQIKICTVVGFPLGYSTLSTKIYEMNTMTELGVDEIDVVLNIGNIKNTNWDLVEEEIKCLSKNKGKTILKLIIESGVLEISEIIQVCKITNKYPIDFLKTSTGFAKTGATVEAVTTMRENLRPDIKIKASGGIKTIQDAEKFIKIGADRLGCSSSVEIIS